MAKVTFTFASEASPANPKSTVIRVKTMQLSPDGPAYAFPPELQSTDCHEGLMATSAGKLVKKALDVRGKYRTVGITLTTELLIKYTDIDGNAVFQETLLEEWRPPRTAIYSSVSSSSVATPQHHEETIVDPPYSVRWQNENFSAIRTL